LPNDFPPWRTVYGYFDDWGKTGVWKRIQRLLYFMVRKAAGRSRLPSIVVIDSQSVKTGKMGGERGCDGGKRVKGRKRHFAVDSLGMPLAISVTAANVHDLTGAKKVLPQVRKFFCAARSARFMRMEHTLRKPSRIGPKKNLMGPSGSRKIWP
jgi:putative transposase